MSLLVAVDAVTRMIEPAVGEKELVVTAVDVPVAVVPASTVGVVHAGAEKISANMTHVAVLENRAAIVDDEPRKKDNNVATLSIAPSQSMAKRAARGLLSAIGTLSPDLEYVLRYIVARQHVRRRYDTQQKTLWWNAFMDSANRPGLKCLQIGVREEMGEKYGPNWTSVDKFDTRAFIDRHDDIHDLKFPDNSFDAIACIAILEHLPQPEVALGELHRVLKPGGLIWVSLPMSFPYHEAPKDYWRVTPDGLRLWMKDFTEIGCGVNYWTRSALACSTHFYGRKP